MKELELIQQLLVEHSGLRFDSERPGRLQEGVAVRMAEQRIGSIPAYYEFLASHRAQEDELQLLIECVTIGETHFFRNPAQFNVLRDHVLPAYVSDRIAGSRTLKIWSAACATGEEPYSIAITLLESLPRLKDWNISILGSDVNRTFLRKAQEAVYGAWSVRQMPPALLERYFTRRGDAYLLDETVRRMVHFVPHNLVTGSLPLAAMQEVDILFCRNVLIYFPVDVTRRVVDRLALCLQEGGYLFLGHAESIWQISDEFTPVEFPHTIVYRKTQTADLPAKPFVSLPEPSSVLEDASAVAGQGPPLATPMAPRSYQLGVEALRKKAHDQALAHFEETLRTAPEYFPASLGKASILADQGKYEDAVAVLSDALHLESLVGEAHYLLGALQAKLGQFEQAIESFRRALYVDHTIAPASFALANIYLYQHRYQKAGREFQNTLKALQDKADGEFVRYCEDITCSDLRAACDRGLRQLAHRKRA